MAFEKQIVSVELEHINEDHDSRYCPKRGLDMSDVPTLWHFVWIRCKAKVLYDNNPIYVTTSGMRWVRTSDQKAIEIARTGAKAELRALLWSLIDDTEKVNVAMNRMTISNENMLWSQGRR